MRAGRATVLVPSADDMLVHLAAHAAIHGSGRATWLRDIKLWADARQAEIDWGRFLATVEAWRLALPVREAFRRTQRELGPVCPPGVRQRLSELHVNWRDRLALRQAPRDVDHPAAHLLVNVLCTPGWRLSFAYLLAVVLPDRGHMGEWYCRRHWGWLPCAHLLRWLWPVVKHFQPLWSWFSKIEARDSRVHGTGVFATRELEPGELIARYRGQEVDHDGLYVAYQSSPSGETRRYEITGKLRFLNHCCRPNAELAGFRLIARKPIHAGREITIDYGEGACTCKQDEQRTEIPTTVRSVADVAGPHTGIVGSEERGIRDERSRDRAVALHA